MPNSIFSIFARSPFQPLQEHMGKVFKCASALKDFFEAVEADDWKTAETVQQRIHHLEEEADTLKKEIRTNLPDGLFMPVPRTDLLELLDRQDYIANKAKDIAGLMLGRQMQIPQQLQQSILEFVSCSINATQIAYQAVQELDELVETGFRGYEVKRVEKLITQLDSVEDEADTLEREVRTSLFALEAGLNPVEVIFLYKIIDWIGEVANRAQKVGHRLHLMLAR
ncbi:TIGR00153 family protein [Gammaproteobacteria bacterium]|nr:TIGR00153 family protein [Gammaproteobacteria bacterium]